MPLLTNTASKSTYLQLSKQIHKYKLYTLFQFCFRIQILFFVCLGRANEPEI